jgi:hypothetical protein
MAFHVFTYNPIHTLPVHTYTGNGGWSDTTGTWNGTYFLVQMRFSSLILTVHAYTGNSDIEEDGGPILVILHESETEEITCTIWIELHHGERGADVTGKGCPIIQNFDVVGIQCTPSSPFPQRKMCSAVIGMWDLIPHESGIEYTTRTWDHIVPREIVI